MKLSTNNPYKETFSVSTEFPYYGMSMELTSNKHINLASFCYTWPDGISVKTETLDQLIDIAKKLNKPLAWTNLNRPKGYYISSTKGLVLIKEMASSHIKNAVCKIAKKHYETLSKTESFDFNKEFINWINDNPMVQELLEEIKIRENNKKK